MNSLNKTLKSMSYQLKKIFSKLKKTGMSTKICLTLACLALIIFIYKRVPDIDVDTEAFNNPDEGHNGEDNYRPEKKYIVKKNDELYDDFYANIYDDLVYSEDKNAFEIEAIKTRSNLTKDSIVLDVGSGTGRHCNELNKLGCSCVGIDKSGSMVSKARVNAPNSEFVKGDALSSMTFQEGYFTHITALYFVVYYMRDKLLFFKNMYRWLKPGGHLIIHLVNKHKFDPMVPAGDPLTALSLQNYVDKRITDTVVVFNNFKYKANFSLKDNNTASFDERFIYPDGKIRHNQHTFWMDNQDKILRLAKNVGFILQSKIDLVDCEYDKQYLYILQKPN